MMSFRRNPVACARSAPGPDNHDGGVPHGEHRPELIQLETRNKESKAMPTRRTHPTYSRQRARPA
jgi:hypothetical protein